ncbi:hypothetical protein D593_1951 [Streptococcus intermedius BA1]|nr:hypothetical protein D593_1951 [Streptococcus intermedius BA1]
MYKLQMKLQTILYNKLNYKKTALQKLDTTSKNWGVFL